MRVSERLLSQFPWVPRHPTALIGSGGKTTLLYQLAQECREAGLRPVLTTTTKMFWPTDQPEVRAWHFEDMVEGLADSRHTPLFFGARRQDKIDGITPEQCRHLAGQASPRPLLYEADGSRRRPLKIHDQHEPVIADLSHAVILVVGLSPWGQALTEENCHRLALSPWAGQRLDPPTLVLYLTRALERLTEVFGPKVVVLNQLDALAEVDRAPLIEFVSDQLKLTVVGRSQGRGDGVAG